MIVIQSGKIGLKIKRKSRNKLEESQEYKFRKTILLNALASLNEREKDIFKQEEL